MNNALTVKINENLYYIGVNDRITRLFENMWPLPDGVAYNSFILTGEKNILMDTVKITQVDKFLEKMDEILNGGKIDYVVINHMEPDHSSALPTIIDLYPEVQIIGNKKTADFLKNYYDIEDNLIIVSDGETLELGDKKLTFYTTPMVHWPESMVAYEEETKTLFSQDAFGGFGTLDGPIFDDEINWDYYLDETIRYYTNIVGKYSQQVQAALKKLSKLDIKVICPLHGPIWRSQPEKIIDLYDKLSKQETEDGVVIIYGSMYGNTEKMAETVARSLANEGIKNVRIHDVSKTDMSYLIANTWRYKGIILGSCTYNNSLFPFMGSLIAYLKQQKMKNHVLGIFGSYSWSGGAVKELKAFAESTGFELLDTVVEAKGAAKDDDLDGLIQLGKEMAEALKK